jgi:N-acyl-L-homoserine lactone synthetase
MGILQDSGSTPAKVVAMDSLAPRLVAGAAPLRIGVALSPANREEVYRLRYQVAVAKGWADPRDLPDGLERDDYDSRAVAVVAWRGEALAATVRVVLPAVGELLPTEQVFGLRLQAPGQAADIGRLIVAPEHGDLGQPLLLGLLGQTWLVMRSQGLSQACGILGRSMARYYRRAGLRTMTLGPPKVYWGEERFPVWVPAESFELLSRRLGNVLG